jgi:heat shock protein HtpX
MITGRPSQLASALMKITGSISRIPAKDLRQMETANALCIVSALKGESLAGLFASHPPMRKRVERLQKLEQEMENQ